MANLNEVRLIGRATNNTIFREKNGKTIAKASMAINSYYRVGAEKKEDTLYVDIVAFGKTGDIMKEGIHKGTLFLASGRLSRSDWEQDGVKHSRMEVIADNIQYLERKKK